MRTVNQKWLLAVAWMLYGSDIAFCADAVDVAAQFVTTPPQPYHWGCKDPQGTGTDNLPCDGGFDCSGLVQYSYAHASNPVSLPEGAGQQAFSPLVGPVADPSCPAGTSCSLDELITAGTLHRGDLLFFYTDDTKSPGTITHVGIYEATTSMISAIDEEHGIIRADLKRAYWQKAGRFLFAKRILATGIITPTINQYPIPTGHSDPYGITAGPDGALWFTEQVSGFNLVGRVARITTAGTITEYPLPFAGNPASITVGPDSALWFTAGNRIGRITTAGNISSFSLPTPSSTAVGITTGPDGAIWFTEFDATADKIGRMTLTGSFTEFPIPTPNSTPLSITAGPDGALWFTEDSVFSNKIGRISTAGVITEYAVPTTFASPAVITSGPDGALWFTVINAIGRITTSGNVTEYPLPPIPSDDIDAWPFGITTGPDGALWFVQSACALAPVDCVARVGRMTTTGTVVVYPLPVLGRGTAAVTTGPDGNLWFTASYTNSIDQVVLH